MIPRHQEIFDRSKARAASGWTSGFLNSYQGDDLKIALRGYRSGFFERIRNEAILNEQRRTRPVYSRWLP